MTGGRVSLSDEELERYARHIVLPQVGGFGQRLLKETNVAIVGAGGIGSGVIPALAGAGVGGLTIRAGGRHSACNELPIQARPPGRRSPGLPW